MGRFVHISGGVGTVGLGIALLLLDMQKRDMIDGVTFSKGTARRHDAPDVLQLVDRGASFVAAHNQMENFRRVGLTPTMTLDDALARSQVVVDCTPKGQGRKNKETIYQGGSATYIYQGSETDVGDPFFMFSLNAPPVEQKGRHVWVMSCNTTNILALTHAMLGLKGGSDFLDEGMFHLIRRANDVGQQKGIIAPEVSIPDDEVTGSHQAADARKAIQQIMGLGLNLFSHCAKVNSPFMHMIVFSFTFKGDVSLEEVTQQFEEDPLIAITRKTEISAIYAAARNWSSFGGRNFNYTVVLINSLRVLSGNRLIGTCFTPQDSNTILNSIAAVARVFYGSHYPRIMDVFISDREQPLLFDEI